MVLSVPLFASGPFAMACTDLQAPSIPDAKVLWITSDPLETYTYPAINPMTEEAIPGTTGDAPPMSFCNVSVALTHPGDNDTVFVSIWLPPTELWNERYTATGGSGLAAGHDSHMLPSLAAGFATSSTDGGLTLNRTVHPDSGLWGLDEDGNVNEALMLNLGYRSIHDMSIASKDIINQFYGSNQTYSYWDGCSQGGRQGYAAAAMYPEDYDGILAVAPAIGFDQAGPATFWPVVVMHNEGEYVPPCIFAAFQAAIVEACDDDDGIEDGLISDYETLPSCPRQFKASSLVGQTVDCDPVGKVTITERHATIVSKILAGPFYNGKEYWFGTTPGAVFSGTANTTYDNETNTWVPVPFEPAAGWTSSVIIPTTASISSTNTNLFNLTYEQYFEAFNHSVEISKPYWSDDFLDLSAFHAAGGKLLSWVGLADQYLPPSHLFNFYDNVTATFGDGNVSAVHDFYSLFTAPGVRHCSGGSGPQPVNPLAALMAWVENGTAPEGLQAVNANKDGEEMTKKLCLYPAADIEVDGEVGCHVLKGMKDKHGDETDEGDKHGHEIDDEDKHGDGTDEEDRHGNETNEEDDQDD